MADKHQHQRNAPRCSLQQSRPGETTGPLLIRQSHLAIYGSYPDDRKPQATEIRAVALPTIPAPDNFSSQPTRLQPPPFPSSVSTATITKTKQNKKGGSVLRTLRRDNKDDARYKQCNFVLTRGWRSAIALCVMYRYIIGFTRLTRSHFL